MSIMGTYRYIDGAMVKVSEKAHIASHVHFPDKNTGSYFDASARRSFSSKTEKRDWLTAHGTLKVKVTVLACSNPFNVAGDCNVNIDDFLALLAAWGPNAGHPADYDLNGFVEVDDFLDLLDNWDEGHDYVVEVLARTD